MQCLVNNKCKTLKKVLFCIGAGLGMLFCALSIPAAQKSINVISLGGQWQFRIDLAGKGIEEK